MLHALLHHKLDETTPEPQRLEDALTSTVFGTLVMVEAADVLAAWLSLARRIDGSQTPVEGPLNGVWFWPQLALAEPDVIIRLGDHLIVIEAKLQSGKADLQRAIEDPDHITDQLQREWVSLGPEYLCQARCGIELREAIGSCARTLVYVVDGRRRRRATREFGESVKLLPADADLRLLTWQTLHEQLARFSPTPSRWRTLLSQYLQDRGLYGFDGFADQRHSRPFEPRWLEQWCCPAGSHAPLHLRQAVGDSQKLWNVLSDWRPDHAAETLPDLPSDWIRRCAVPPHSFLLAASWAAADSRPFENHFRRTMGLFSAERAPGLRRCVMKFTITQKGA